MNKISVNLYGGIHIFSNKEAPLSADIISCDRAEQCSFYQSGNCLRCRSMCNTSCCFGNTTTIKGYTSRAAKYYDFKSKYEEDPVFAKLKYPKDLLGKLDDTLFMKLTYINVIKTTEKEDYYKKRYNDFVIYDSGFCGKGKVFIKLADVTTGLLDAIFSFTPCSMMGTPIKDYENHIVPDILLTMQKVLPDLYAELIKDYPKYDMAPNYVGKEIYIISLKPKTLFKIDNKEWLYDGEYITTNNLDIGLSSPWWAQGGSYSTIRIKVNDKMTIKVQDNAIVDADTKFV